MLKVCFVSPEYLPLAGGTGAYVYYLSNQLIEHGHSIRIVTGYDKSQYIKINNQRDAYFLKTLRIPVIKSFLFAGAASRKLNQIHKKDPIDIVHANLPLVPNFAIPNTYEKTLISTVHSTWKGEAESIKNEPYTRLNSNEQFMVSFNWFLRIFENRMLERSDRLIAVSEYTKRELAKYYKVNQQKITVIHNGVDTQKFKPTQEKRKAKTELGFKPEDKIILSVGRLYARKGLFTLIESMPPVIRRFKNAKFVISGKGLANETKKLVDHATKLGVNNNMIFTGYFPDKQLPRLYQAADIFAFSTFYENLPFAILEALSTGLPVVTTNVGGIPEMITNAKNGFLVEPFNSNELASKILYFLEHPEESAETGILARKTIKERFDWQLIVEKVLKIYEAAVSKK
jgi:glycosyltransferase involved in cell wall biosynthesis